VITLLHVTLCIVRDCPTRNNILALFLILSRMYYVFFVTDSVVKQCKSREMELQRQCKLL